MKTLVVREYARLTIDTIKPTMDLAQIPSSAFEWLCNLSSGFKKGGAPLLQIENRRYLKLDNYVGIVKTPCGTILEILPKHSETSNEEDIQGSRKLLTKMLKIALDLPLRTTDKADIETFNYPLLEWLMKEFTLALDHLIKRGIRFYYLRIEEEQRYLRGKLDIVKRMRQAPGRDHIFPIRHDVFLADRPENRLLKTALLRVCKTTQQPDTWRLSHELAGLLAEIPESQDIKSDFRLWQSSRLMTHYKPIHPLCELMLSQHMPLALFGKTEGISLLFPMEKLFERYVDYSIRKVLPSPYTMRAQAASMSLCNHNEREMFQLKPDFLIQLDNKTVLVMDTKWKLISELDGVNKYGLSQNDFYQLFAYGHKYLEAKGEMLLIYPITNKFSNGLPPFDFDISNDLRLWVAPFDLENDKLIWPSALKDQKLAALQ